MALIRGVAARFKQLGKRVGGFNAIVTSSVFKGSGLSSSAAFEVLMADILNGMYNGGELTGLELAQISQYAENVYFGKPSGLMDQAASALGGLVTIDFRKSTPRVENVDFDFAARGYALVVVGAGGNHADLTGEYAAIPIEMKPVSYTHLYHIYRGYVHSSTTINRICAGGVEQVCAPCMRARGHGPGC